MSSLLACSAGRQTVASTGTPTTHGTPFAATHLHDSHPSPYLKQRAIAALIYLTTHGTHFGGGTLEFQHGQPRTVVPVAGRLVIYPASHVHRVTPVKWGTREVLTLWFARDDGRVETDVSSAGEDAVVLQTLHTLLSTADVPRHATSMYTLPDGSNLCMRRLVSCLQTGAQSGGVPPCCWESRPGEDAGQCLSDAVAKAMTAWQQGGDGDDMVAAQHASASTVVGGASVWQATLHALQAQWSDAVRVMVDEGLHIAASW